MQGARHLASGDLCRESAPLSQGSRASLHVDLPRDEMALLMALLQGFALGAGPPMAAPCTLPSQIGAMAFIIASRLAWLPAPPLMMPTPRSRPSKST